MGYEVEERRGQPSRLFCLPATFLTFGTCLFSILLIQPFLVSYGLECVYSGFNSSFLKVRATTFYPPVDPSQAWHS